MTFGIGKTLRQLSPILSDKKKRQEIILDRVERDSVIEGLPKFDQHIRQECLKEMEQISA